MFLISKQREKSHKVLRKFQQTVISSGEITCGEIHTHQINGYWLHWFSCKPSDNLHVFANCIVLGKLDFAEKCSRTPIVHANKQLSHELHPLSTATIVEFSAVDIVIRPNHITNVYFSANGISDMQLILADLEDYRPEKLRLAVLSSVGYLPSNLTLFEDIHRIPFLHSLSVKSRSLVRTVTLKRLENNDNAMVERLVQIVPGVESYLGISGGYDSRFVLGIMLKAGIQPKLLHLHSDEEEVVESLAKELSLDLRTPDTSTPLLTADLYTMLTDGQIYFRGGNYSSLRAIIHSEEAIFHMGLFADSIIKNAFKTAWKIPSRRSIHERLVRHALLSNCPTILKSLRPPVNKQDLHQLLMNEVLAWDREIELRTSKEWANWFYFLHRGIRWSQAAVADLSFFTYPIFLLSDIQAQLLGISSSKWSNFHKDRVRKMNHELMNTVRTPYDDGGEAISDGYQLLAFRKLKYEYIDRLLVWRRERRKFASRASTASDLLPHIPDSQHTCFSDYFAGTLAEVLSMDVSYSEKRSAITLYYVLQYLHK